MEISCDHCGKIFTTFPYKVRRQKNNFCSTVCQYAFKKTRVKLVCEICQTSFTTHKYRIKNQKNCFCSKKCSDKYLIKPRLEKKCLYCGLKFKYLPSKLKHGNIKFCSVKCCKNSKKPLNNRTCSNCEKKFHSTDSQIKNGRGNFCCLKCSIVFYKTNKHPNFKHGYGFFKQYSKKNRPDKCQVCNNGAKLDLHHIDGNEFNNKISNFIFLCRSCHMRVHAISGKYAIAIHKALTILNITSHLQQDSVDLNLVIEKLKNYSLEPLD